MSNASTETRIPTAPRCVEHAENRRRFVERIVDVLVRSAARDGESLADVATKLEDGTYSWHVLATLAKERNVDPDEATRVQIIRALRIRGSGLDAPKPRSPIAMAFAEIGRAGVYAARRERAKRILELTSVDRAVEILTLGDADPLLVQAVEAEDDWREDCARVEEFE